MGYRSLTNTVKGLIILLKLQQCNTLPHSIKIYDLDILSHISAGSAGALILLGIRLKAGNWTSLTPENLCTNLSPLFYTTCIQGYEGKFLNLC